MRYNCGHDGCDICGARSCADAHLRVIGKNTVCESCLNTAVTFAVNAAETFGGCCIDVSRKCGNDERKEEQAKEGGEG